MKKRQSVTPARKAWEQRTLIAHLLLAELSRNELYKDELKGKSYGGVLGFEKPKQPEPQLISIGRTVGARAVLNPLCREGIRFFRGREQLFLALTPRSEFKGKEKRYGAVRFEGGAIISLSGFGHDFCLAFVLELGVRLTLVLREDKDHYLVETGNRYAPGSTFFV